MVMLCGVALILTGVVGMGLQFIAVAIAGLGPGGIISAVFDTGLTLPFLFCLALIILGILIFFVELSNRTRK